MSTLIDGLKKQFTMGSVVNQFIMINIGVFVIALLFNLFGFFFQTDLIPYFMKFMAVPAKLSALIYKPWTIITYMFTHIGIWHIIMNMIMLYFGGQLFLQFLGSKRFISTYFLAGIAGAILYILAFNVFPVFKIALKFDTGMIGASASVIGILIAAATLTPNYQVNLVLLGPVKLKWIAFFFILMDLLSLPKGNPGGHIAHLGGAIYGFLYITAYRKGNDWSVEFFKVIDGIKSLFTRKPKMKVEYSNRQHSGTHHTSQKVNEDQAVIDAILDKISRSGYDSLSKREKEILFKAGSRQ